ncbi:patatin-like phospholipase family protein [Litorilinea aerophila]|uniref:Patatin-like phospholipase family protein n=1 Tax=Litorilinea aerophila TaxID=1204385 RepID=A0A540V9F7_9CHLR|nr:patatin-like phospholipase family protein [Litorilinea aerophila]MCC9078733.1 patatin-like phospholipase family protein [Litorilinea aerophila]OUC05443.1 hypothetical protein RY27_27250 [Litorilinea aerophila]GIV78316.1 MAG: hypothetical patatin-like protein [Litorilinea sp.]
MRAFVLSGGGNLGPLQVGALRALLERDIRPQMLVGCSAGALNAAFLAREPTLEQVEHLADMWRQVTRQDVYPNGRLSVLWRFLSGQDSLYDNRRFYAFLQRIGVSPAWTFGQIQGARLYVTATNLRTGQLHVFGDDPNDRVLDALMASTALTPLHPPWTVNGERYIDGGTVTPLPLRVALERGVREIYSLHIVSAREEEEEPGLVRGVVGLLRRSVATMLRLQAQHDLLLTEERQGKIRLHHIRLSTPNPPKATDFSGEEEMFDLGYRQAVAYLEQRAGASTVSGRGSSVWWRRLAEAVGIPRRMEIPPPERQVAGQEALPPC